MTATEALSEYAAIPLPLAELVFGSAWDQGFPVRDIRSNCRRRELVEARWLIAAQARLLGYSLWQIGRALNRDHTTIIHGLGRAVNFGDKSQLIQRAYPNHGIEQTVKTQARIAA